MPTSHAMQTQLSKWGNSTGLRIPAELLAYLGGDKNAKVEITGLPTGGLLIKPVQPPTQSRAQLVARLRASHRKMPMGTSVVRQMRDEEI
ncbi:AbrB/MazE/SpoVT family DNA-binding domain-containing protein [Vandammella animalimorsus]|uniref:AbrB/MazE/SpoVT family DNA-binding domain-containing protein n=1 Tax=Vandammella animalimorsus TaxID=2029117 RepID=A0A2A2T2Y5_9BURK|nr:AbrB/MazE/SpoVT family DNA-binding domain-containing protein [Vandammella animalimorsus]PAT31110.1 AbrB/MazE/SpoVT family DNA-binding domain-containing protein [Vandammella animalimorsus]PAX15899.1 AbrB/MazE/SpoVT family DNA-binding domain-containing protein [Vandammella animalimorsus]PAX17728.1 AbrB/MazE/SpoVT family DNA-binding domain-containing protein [Vandammella animalimorsus]